MELHRGSYGEHTTWQLYDLDIRDGSTVHVVTESEKQHVYNCWLDTVHREQLPQEAVQTSRPSPKHHQTQHDKIVRKIHRTCSHDICSFCNTRRQQSYSKPERNTAFECYSLVLMPLPDSVFCVSCQTSRKLFHGLR